MVEFILVNIVLCVTIAILWTKVLSPRKNKRQDRKPGRLREDMEVDYDHVPEFKPSWRNEQ